MVVGVSGVVTSCVLCTRVSCVLKDVEKLVVSRVQQRILTHLLDWERCPSSQSSPFSLIRTVSKTKFSVGFGCSFSTRHLVRDLTGLFLLVVGSVAIHLVHVNANLFDSPKIDQFRMLSRLSLDTTAIFAT